MKQYKEEWDAVMEKLGDVASIVIDVGESCQAHGLVEEDLPDGVRKILESLHRCVVPILNQVSLSDVCEATWVASKAHSDSAQRQTLSRECYCVRTCSRGLGNMIRSCPTYFSLSRSVLPFAPCGHNTYIS